MKKPRSIVEKLTRKGLPVDIESASKHLTDIAGIRVICNYIDDVYTIAQLLVKQDDVTLLRESDYIKNPKPNGYRSLHIVVSIPVFLSSCIKHIPVEIQLRTIAMDFWASLEHKLRYKSDTAMDEVLASRLYQCAVGISNIDNEMQDIHRLISSGKQTDKESHQE